MLGSTKHNEGENDQKLLLLIVCKFLVKMLFLYTTVKLDLDIENPQTLILKIRKI